MLNNNKNITALKTPIISFMLVMGVFLCSVSILSSQDDSKIDYADSLYSVAFKHKEDKEYQKSNLLFRLANPIYEKENLWIKWYKTLYYNTSIKSDIDSLLFYKDKIPREEYVSYKIDYKIGTTLKSRRNYKEAVKYLKIANQGFQSFYDVDPYLVDSNLHKYLIRSNNAIGISYSRLQDQNTAIKYAKRAGSLALIHKDTSEYLDQLVLVGNYLYYNNENLASIKQFKYALAQGADPSVVYPYLADSYLSLDSLDSAENYLSSNLNDDSDADVDYSLASLYELKGEPSKAITSQLKGINTSIKNEMPLRVIHREKMILALMHKRFGNITEGIQYIQEVLHSEYPGAGINNLYDRPPVEEDFPDIWIIEALWYKASYFASLYSDKNDDRDISEASFYYDLLLDYMERLKLQYYSTDSKYSMGAYSKQIYTEASAFYQALFQKSNDINDLDKALSLTQRSNSFVLKNEVSFRKSLDIANVSDTTIQKYLRLASAAADASITDDDNPIQEFDKFNHELIDQYPQLANYQKDNDISISEIQASIDSNSVLIKYHYFDNRFYRFMITDESIELDTFSFGIESKDIVREVLAMNAGKSTWDEAQYRAKSKSLYDLILGDKIGTQNFEGRSHLIVVPDGPLKSLSFNSLVISENRNAPLTSDDYLISTHAISYLYYCSQLYEDTNSVSQDGNFVGFGLEYDDAFLKEIIKDYKKYDDLGNDDTRSFSLKQLKYATDETRNAVELLGGTSYINSQASLENIKQALPNSSVVHISAHALVNMDDHLESAIIFNKDKEENYRLKYSDILNLNLNSALVVLSACQTGIGKGIDGEALASLSRAFIQSGCKSAVGAYWEVPDRSTMKVMDQFYINLKNGSTKAEAMRHAQLKYLDDEGISTPRTRMPLYWASWAVYGDNTPIFIESNNGHAKMLILIGALSLLLLSFVVMKKMRK